MIKRITWKQIFPIWKNDLWPNRQSPIEPNSAMNFLFGYDMENMESVPTFFGYFVDKKIVGVNSGHRCSDNSYRSRGLWVYTDYRSQGIGQLLLKATIDQAVHEKCSMIWSYPRFTSWPTYSRVGFNLASEWNPSETNSKNAFANFILQ
jgi:GNAT superfamily N-acetyltransferase